MLAPHMLGPRYLVCALACGSDLSSPGLNHSFAQLLKMWTCDSTQLSLQITMEQEEEEEATRKMGKN